MRIPGDLAVCSVGNAALCRGELAWYTDSSRVHALEDSLVDLTPTLAGTARLLRSVVLPKEAGLAAPVADRILVRSGSNLHFDVPRALGKEPRFTCLSSVKVLVLLLLGSGQHTGDAAGAHRSLARAHVPYSPAARAHAKPRRCPQGPAAHQGARSASASGLYSQTTGC